MKIKWNRKAWPIDLQKVAFLIFLKNRRLFCKNDVKYISIQNIHYAHLWMLKTWPSLISRNVFFFCFSFFQILTFLKFSSNPYFIWNLERFNFDESLYKPSRQWLGWQFTGGPKSITSRPKNWILQIVLLFVSS